MTSVQKLLAFIFLTLVCAGNFMYAGILIGAGGTLRWLVHFGIGCVAICCVAEIYD